MEKDIFEGCDNLKAVFVPKNQKYKYDELLYGHSVVSSSWKFIGLQKLQQMWADRKLPGSIADVTPDTISDDYLIHANLDEMDHLQLKGMEIEEWLKRQGRNAIHYVIFDDTDDITPEQEPHFVRTDAEVGITEEDAKKVIRILYGE